MLRLIGWNAYRHDIGGNMVNVAKAVSRAIRLPINELRVIGQHAIDMIHKDAFVGIMQDGSSNHKYSRQYAKYKANSMRRLTSDVTAKDWEDKFNGVGSNFYRLPNGKVVIRASRLSVTKDKKYKQKQTKRISNKYYGKSLNTETAFVNMKLTGDMFKGLKVTDKTGATDTGLLIQLGYDPKDAQKIIGNKKRGYIVDTLRKENADTIAYQIINAIIIHAKNSIER